VGIQGMKEILMAVLGYDHNVGNLYFMSNFIYRAISGTACEALIEDPEILSLECMPLIEV
jgi:hypothetical protein